MAQARQGTTYFWFAQNPRRELTLAVRTSGDPVATAALVASEVRAIDPNQPVADVRPMREYIAEDLARPRFTMTLLGCFAVAALLLAAVGLYGVISFRVTQRTREIGVRVALGAQNRDVLRLVMGKGLVLTGAGVAIGIAAALAFGRVAAGFLYGVTPTDPPTLLAVSVLLTGVAVVATYLPARRAMRLDAAAALRCD